MNIDFPPPSKGTYNNAGSSRQLANYLEHEDLERMEKGIYTEGFFNLTQENLYKSQVVKDIDRNIGQLMKTDAKFYAIHISPSTKELQAMGATEAEQAEAMRWYIRTVFVPEYARNFNKGLEAEDIKFYGKIHFDRDSSRSKGNTDETGTLNNMHCHIIMSRKDQANKVKLSPLTNHRNTKKGAIRGGFDRSNLFQRVEKGFDVLFKYDRQLAETFQYCNTMKNGSIDEQISMQETELASKKESVQMSILADRQIFNDGGMNEEGFADLLVSDNAQEQTNGSIDLGLSSALGIFSPEVHGDNFEEEYFRKMGKVKKRKRGLRR